METLGSITKELGVAIGDLGARIGASGPSLSKRISDAVRGGLEFDASGAFKGLEEEIGGLSGRLRKAFLGSGETLGEALSRTLTTGRAAGAIARSAREISELVGQSINRVDVETILPRAFTVPLAPIFNFTNVGEALASQAEKAFREIRGDEIAKSFAEGFDKLEIDDQINRLKELRRELVEPLSGLGIRAELPLTDESQVGAAVSRLRDFRSQINGIQQELSNLQRLRPDVSTDSAQGHSSTPRSLTCRGRPTSGSLSLRRRLRM